MPKSAHPFNNPEFKQELGRLIDLQVKHTKMQEEFNDLKITIADLRYLEGLELVGDRSFVVGHRGKPYLITVSCEAVESCEEIQPGQVFFGAERELATSQDDDWKGSTPATQCLAELKAVLAKYSASITWECSDSSDLHGVNGETMTIWIGRENVLAVDGACLSAADIEMPTL
jgi:hypothetical protein